MDVGAYKRVAWQYFRFPTQMPLGASLPLLLLVIRNSRFGEVGLPRYVVVHGRSSLVQPRRVNSSIAY